MNGLKLILSAMLLGLVIYTSIVVANHGWNFLSDYFGNIFAINWSGQINLDFASYLILSALWVAWRHAFSGSGIILALIALVAGMLFFSAYLLVAIGKADGDIKKLLLGDR